MAWEIKTRPHSGAPEYVAKISDEEIQALMDDDAFAWKTVLIPIISAVVIGLLGMAAVVCWVSL